MFINVIKYILIDYNLKCEISSNKRSEKYNKVRNKNYYNIRDENEFNKIYEISSSKFFFEMDFYKCSVGAIDNRPRRLIKRT